MTTTATTVAPTLTAVSRCSNASCDDRATVWMYGPDGKLVPGSWCRPCAERAAKEYREKLGETWPVEDATVYVDKWYVVIADGRHYGYPTVEGAAGDIVRNQTKEASPRVQVRGSGTTVLRDLTPIEKRYLEDAVTKRRRQTGQGTSGCRT